ncbi:MAG: hypothetical protein LC623_03865, partial [Halobacteriales archaeon]|nr:hypothetical protein [Halobacteriales archaeon]
MADRGQDFAQRVASMQARVGTLGRLRSIVSLPLPHDIDARQWDAIAMGLSATQARLDQSLRRAARDGLPRLADVAAARRLNAHLGRLELDLTKAFAFFDMYADLLTQRHARDLAALLRGCDALAWDAIGHSHPALTVVPRPLVYCDRGFGASVIREQARLPDGTPNPLPLIQIPYSRLKEKYNLVSLLHESGHEVMVRLGLVEAWPKAMAAALRRAGAPPLLQQLYALWTRELGPDFWAFCLSGFAQTSGMRTIVALPPEHVFAVSLTDPHPPAYLRVLISVQWCRHLWGKGPWDRWEREWLALYPLADAEPHARATLQAAVAYVPLVARTYFEARFPVFGDRPVAAQFDLRPLAPNAIAARCHRRDADGMPDLAG